MKHKEHGIEINGVALDFPLKMGVDTMAEDETGEWLYFSSAFDQHVWRVRYVKTLSHRHLVTSRGP